MSVSEERARSGSDSRTQLASKTWGRFDKEREETLGSHTAAYEYEEVFFFFFFSLSCYSTLASRRGGKRMLNSSRAMKSARGHVLCSGEEEEGPATV